HVPGGDGRAEHRRGARPYRCLPNPSPETRHREVLPMTTTDTDALQERIAEKMRESLTHKYGAGSDLEAPRATRDGMVSQMGGHIDVPHLAEEVMVVVAAEVRKAKAEALRECSDGIDLAEIAEEWSQGPGNRDDMHWAAGNAASSVVLALYDRAAEYERGDQR